MCLLRAESVRAGCSDLCPVGYLQGQRLNSLSEQPVPVLDHLHSKKVSYVYMKFLVFSMCSLPLVLSLGRGWVCCLYSSHRVFMCMNKSPWAFSRLRSPSSLCLSSYVRYSSPLITFAVLCWTRSSMSTSHCGELTTGPSAPDVSCQGWVEGKAQLSAGNALSNAAQNDFSLLFKRTHWWLIMSFFFLFFFF